VASSRHRTRGLMKLSAWSKLSQSAFITAPISELGCTCLKRSHNMVPLR
jgi:hypothetical protein